MRQICQLFARAGSTGWTPDLVDSIQAQIAKASFHFNWLLLLKNCYMKRNPASYRLCDYTVTNLGREYLLRSLGAH